MAEPTPHIAVCGVLELPRMLRELAATNHPVANIISVRSAPAVNRWGFISRDFTPVTAEIETPSTDVKRPERLLLTCDDVANTQQSQKPPTPNLLIAAYGFARRHMTHSPENTLLVHCAFGLSRSPSTALAIIASHQLSTDGFCNPKQCVDQVLTIRPGATFNPLMVLHTDNLLGLNGALVDSVNNHPDVKRNIRNTRLKRRVFSLTSRLARKSASLSYLIP